MAVDVTGPERVRPFAAGHTFPTVVDSQNVLGRLLDFDVVPNGLLLDAEGRIAMLHVAGFDARRDDVRGQVEGLLDELAGRAGSTPALEQRPLEVELLLTEVASAPGDADLRLALAEAQARAGDDAAAVASYQRAVELAPDAWAAHFGLGTALARLGRADEAVAAWKRALGIDPANFVVRKQIWAHRQPDRFYPEIDFEWQKAEMAREAAGQSDLPPVPAR